MPGERRFNLRFQEGSTAGWRSESAHLSVSQTPLLVLRLQSFDAKAAEPCDHSERGFFCRAAGVSSSTSILHFLFDQRYQRFPPYSFGRAR